MTDQEKELTKRARQGHERFYQDFQQIVRDTPDDALPRQIRVLIETVLIQEILEPTHESLDFYSEATRSEYLCSEEERAK